MNSFQVFVLTFIGCLMLFLNVVASAKTKDELLVCFGDSVSDNGNTFEYTQQAWPVTSGYPEHVFTDTETWTDFLKDLRDKKKEVGKVKLMNYALGSATSDNAFIQGYTGPTSSWPVAGGVQQFEMYQLATNQTGFHDPKKQNVLYFVLIGVNDIYFRWASGSDPSDSEFLNEVVYHINKLVQQIIQNEVAHNHRDYRVVVANAYPIETVPFTYYYPGQFDGITEKFNEFLHSVLQDTKAAFPDVDLIEFDLSSVIYDLIDDAPSGVSTNTSCVQGDYFQGDLVVCKDPTKFVYYDSFHPSSWVHQEIAKQLNKVLG